MSSQPKIHADRATATAYFEDWQKKLLEQAGLLHARIELIKARQGQTGGHLLDALTAPDEAVTATSKYESPEFAALLGRALLQVSERASAMNLKMPPQPVIGTWHFGTLNACAFTAPGTSYPIIALNEGVISTGIFLAAILSHCLHGKGDDFDADWRSKLAANPALQGWFAEMIAKTLFLGRPDLTRRYELEQGSRRLFHGIAHHFVLFAVGHEYAHCILDHHMINPATDKRAPVERPEGWTELPPAIPALWGDEFIADKMGYELTRHAAISEGLPRYLGLCGP